MARPKKEIVTETTVPKVEEIFPEVPQKEEPKEKIYIFIDPKRTNGGIVVNGKRRVGKVQCKSEEEANDWLRIQEEYAAAYGKLNDPSIKLRNQSIETSKKAFMADPMVYGKHPSFSKVYGLLDPFQWQFVSENDRLEWQEERMGLFNY